MKKEGTGEPGSPDISLDADVKMRELRFEDVPDPEVRFRGNTSRNSVWGSRRENLPDEVRDGVVYRDAEVRLRIATEVVSSDPGLSIHSDREREKTGLEHRRKRTGQQATETKKEKE